LRPLTWIECASDSSRSYRTGIPPGGPLFADASRAQVRAALVPEDVAEFDRQWRAVMTTATETLDLTSVHRALESWRRIAWLTQANGPDGYRRMLARAERTLRTGELPPTACRSTRSKP